MSLLFITHGIGVVEYIADRVAVMRNAAFVEQDIVDSVLQQPAADYTRPLLAAEPQQVRRPYLRRN